LAEYLRLVMGLKAETQPRVQPPESFFQDLGNLLLDGQLSSRN
jgi:hypothetical protein